MRTGILDLGGDALSLTVAEPTPSGWFHPVRRESVVLRLQRTIERHGALPTGTLELASEALRRLVAASVRAGCTRVVGRIRSDLALATNLSHTVRAFEEAVGAELPLLTPPDEGRLTLRAVCSSVAVGTGPVLVLELDGPVVRLAFGVRDRMVWVRRCNLGPGDDPRRLDALLEPVAAAAPPRLVLAGPEAARLVLAAAALADSHHPTSTANQLSVRARDLARHALRRVDAPAEHAEGAGDDHGQHRAAQTLVRVLGQLDADTVVCSTAGLADGIVLDVLAMASPASDAALRAGAVDDLAAMGGTERRHAQHVARLAARLFNALQQLHRLPLADQELLCHGARLHDVGAHLGTVASHRLGAERVQSAGLRGFSPTEIDLLACLVRFHKGAPPAFHHPLFSRLDQDLRERCARLVALLRLVDGLDHGHEQAVTELRADIDEDLVVLDVAGHGDLEYAAFGARSKAAAFEHVFGRNLIVRPVTSRRASAPTNGSALAGSQPF